MTPKLPAPLVRVLPAIASLWALVLTSSAPGAQEATTWVKGPSSAARILSGGGVRADHTYLPGVEIELSGNAHTYWRTPGKSGVPPIASFEGSKNLASAELLFPVPNRIQEAGTEIYGYRGRIIFPLKVVPADPAQPVELALELRYAACDRICVPAKANGRVTLAPGQAPSAFAAAIESARALVPQPAGPNAPSLNLVRKGPSLWSVSVDPARSDVDLFAEAPDGWFFETHQRPHGFDLVLAERPATGNDVPVTFTLTSPQGGWERSMKLDVTGSTP